MKTINSIAAFLFFFGIFNFSIAQSITVNSTDYKQVIDMMGGDLERNSIAVQNAKNTKEIIDWGFKDIAFNYCRVQYDKNQEIKEGVKNWGFYRKQIITMKQVKDINPKIKFFATMRTDYDGFGNDNNAPDWIINYKTRKIDIDKYATFLADYLEYMHDQGLTIHTLSITKEWTSFVYASRAKKIIPKLHAICDQRGVPRAKISDQGFWSIKQGIKYIDDVAEMGTADLYDSFCSHDYDRNDNSKWSTIISKSKALGKKLYHDEFSTGAGGPSNGDEPPISKPIGVYIEKAETYKAGLNGEIFFEIWSRGINKETRSIYFKGGGTGRRIRGYYIMKQFANTVLDTRYIPTAVSSASKVYTMAFRKGNKMVVWVINKGSNRYRSLPISLDSSIIDGTIQTAYWTNDTSAPGLTRTYNASGKSFSPTIEGESITSFVFNVSDDTTAAIPVHIRKRNANNFAIDGGNGGANRQNLKLWSSDSSNENQQWLEIDRGNGFYSYKKSGTNYCIDGNNNGANGQNVFIYTCEGSNQNQHWKKENVAGTNSFKLIKRNAQDFALNGGPGGARNQNIELGPSSSSSQDLHWVINPINTLSTGAIEDEVQSITFYPNPVNDVLNIDFKREKEAKISILNLTGQKVYSGTIQKGNNKIGLSSLSTGMYIMKIVDGEEVTVRKIIHN